MIQKHEHRSWLFRRKAFQRL